MSAVGKPGTKDDLFGNTRLPKENANKLSVEEINQRLQENNDRISDIAEKIMELEQSQSQTQTEIEQLKSDSKKIQLQMEKNERIDKICRVIAALLILGLIAAGFVWGTLRYI